MIGSARTGGSFSGLGSYLTGDESRVSYVKTRNTFEERPDRVAQEMKDAAAASERVEKPVYHVSVSWPEEDQTTTQERVEAMEEVLEDIGLGDRQTLIVEHDDGKPHVHAMVNRVQHDPTKRDHGTAWDDAHDWERIESSLREIERDRGWREVPGKMSENHGKDQEEIADAMTRGQRQYTERTGDLPVVKKAQIRAGEAFEHAEGWEELDRALGENGLEVELKGRGGVVREKATGDACKLSSVGREYSLGKLEDRFEESYGEYLERREEVAERPDGQEPGREPERGQGERDRRSRPAGREDRGGEEESQRAEAAERGGRGGSAEPEDGRDAPEPSRSKKQGGPAGDEAERGSERRRGGGRGDKRSSKDEQAGRSHFSESGAGSEDTGRNREGNQESGGGFSGSDKESELGRVAGDSSLDRDRDSGDPNGDPDPLQYDDAKPLGRAGRVESFISRGREDRGSRADRESISGAERGGQGEGEGSPGEGREAGEEPREGGERGVGRSSERSWPAAGGGEIDRSEETGEGPSEGDPLEDLGQKMEGPGPEEAGLSRRQKRLLRKLLREDEAEEEGLFEGIWSREEAKEVHDYLDERGREDLARRVSREWEEEAPENLSLRGEEGKIRPALDRGEARDAAEAFQKVDDARRDGVWRGLRDGEKRQVLHGIAELRRRRVGTQAAYEGLSEEEKAVAVRAQMSGMTGREDGRVAEELAALAEGREGPSETVSAIEDALPSQSSVEALRSAFEKAKQMEEKQSRGGGEDESQSRGYGGRGR